MTYASSLNSTLISCVASLNLQFKYSVVLLLNLNVLDQTSSLALTLSQILLINTMFICKKHTPWHLNLDIPRQFIHNQCKTKWTKSRSLVQPHHDWKVLLVSSCCPYSSLDSIIHVLNHPSVSHNYTSSRQAYSWNLPWDFVISLLYVNEHHM